jgi:putative phosphoesterase
MNNLSQLDSFLIGSVEDERALQGADQAVILVLADTHGDTALVETIIRAFGPRCGALVFCGDGAADIASLMPRAREVVPALAALVRGNGDEDFFSTHGAVGSKEAARVFSVTFPGRIVFSAAGHIVFAAHGHRYSVDYSPEQIARVAEQFGADIVLHGHTHRPFKSSSIAPLVINPGSCARPRGDNPPSFAVITLARGVPGAAVQFYEIKPPDCFLPLNR